MAKRLPPRVTSGPNKGRWKKRKGSKRKKSKRKGASRRRIALL